MKKKVLAFVLVAAMAVSLVGCAGNTTSGNESSGTDGEADTNTLYIGVAAPITGDMAETGVMMDVASRMAVDEINEAGGVNGYQLGLVLYDTKADPKESTEVARTFVEDDRIIAVCGDTTTSQVMAAAPIYEEGGLVQLTPTASGNDFPAMGDYQFSIAGRAADEIPEYVKNVLQGALNCKRLGIIYANDDWGSEIKTSVEQECEGTDIEIVTVESFMTGETDFSSALSKMRQAEPDVLLLAAQYTEGALSAQQVDQMGWDIPMTTQGSLVQPAFCALAPSTCTFVGQCPIVFSEDVPDAYAFAQKFASYEGSGGIQPSLRAAATYNAIYALAEAIKNCGDDITRANVRDNLAQIKDFPILGGTTVTFEPEGYVHLQYVTVTVRDGEWVPYQ